MVEALASQPVAALRLLCKLFGNGQQRADNFRLVPLAHTGGDDEATQLNLAVRIGASVGFALLEFGTASLPLFFALSKQQFRLLFRHRLNHAI